MNSEALRNLFSAPPVAILAVLALVLIGAAYYDLRYRRIPNWLTLAGILLGFGINTAIGAPDGGLVFALKGFAVAFGIYIVLYIVRAMGAGDVKLMAAVGALVGAQRWFGIFIVTAILGGVAAFALAVARGRLQRTFFNVGFILSEMTHGRPAYVGKEELDVRSQKGMSLAHGAVIAAATAVYLVIAASLGR